MRQQGPAGSKGLLVLQRRHGSAAFTALALTEDDTLDVPEVGITVPAAELYVAELYLADLYEDVDFADGAAGG